MSFYHKKKCIETEKKVNFKGNWKLCSGINRFINWTGLTWIFLVLCNGNFWINFESFKFTAGLNDLKNFMGKKVLTEIKIPVGKFLMKFFFPWKKILRKKICLKISYEKKLITKKVSLEKFNLKKKSYKKNYQRKKS